VEIEGVGDLVEVKDAVWVVDCDSAGWNEGAIGKVAPGGGELDGNLWLAVAVEVGLIVGGSITPGGAGSGDWTGLGIEGLGNNEGSVGMENVPLTEA